MHDTVYVDITMITIAWSGPAPGVADETAWRGCAVFHTRKALHSYIHTEMAIP